ncbi:hypothetical protein [Actinokineospora sp.]|uniref:hypothetical protein n=1 Tax=Actinokineospora sp. TaxID=1872133 RepID=UPI004037CF74
MPDRKRVLAWVAAAVLVVGTVVVLRTPGDGADRTGPTTGSVPPPVRVTRYAADGVVLPEPGARPEAPRDVVAVPSPGRVLVSWSDSRAVAHELRWTGGGQAPGTRLVTVPDTQLDGLVDTQEYRIEVRAVDAFGRRSEPTRVAATPGRGDPSWRAGLTGLLDDFPDSSTLRADVPGSRWHLSGYRGCVDLGERGPGEAGLPVDLGCGADEAVLRARGPLRLPDRPGDDGVLARFVVLTDAAGPQGRLTLDLVPGPADRVGTARGTVLAGPDPTLPAGAIRAVIDDAGARVNTGPDLDPAVPTATVSPPPKRGAGALHLFELRVSTTGVTVLQDGRIVAVAAVVPRWREASALVGFRGPQGRRSRVHLASAGFTGPPAPVPPVIEVPVNVATRQVLSPDAPAPASGTTRRPLRDALAARFMVTMAVSAGLDATAVQVQLGSELLPARPAVPGPPVAAGSVVTVIADVPPGLLGGAGPDSLSPFVVRAPGAGTGAVVQESYLEITPAPAAGPQTTTQPRRTDRERPTRDALPTSTVDLGDSAGAPLPASTVAPVGRLVVSVVLDGSAAQWDTGSVAGVQGFQLWLDGRIAAGVPTSIDGPSAGGRYVIPLSLTDSTPGKHVLEVRVFGVDGSQSSLLESFTVT